MRRTRLWRGIGMGIAAAAMLTGASAAASSRTTEVTRVIDGDTFVIAGGERVRVRNFDTPELRGYDCAAERAAGVAARDAARAILLRRTVTLRVDGRDRYRRLIADVTVHNGPRSADFVARMVASGHGARWRYGREPQPDWCRGRDEALYEEIARRAGEAVLGALLSAWR